MKQRNIAWQRQVKCAYHVYVNLNSSDGGDSRDDDLVIYESNLLQRKLNEVHED